MNNQVKKLMKVIVCYAISPSDDMEEYIASELSKQAEEIEQLRKEVERLQSAASDPQLLTNEHPQIGPKEYPASLSITCRTEFMK